MARLGVNIDHIATLRQTRAGADPDPIAAAVLVELAGADGVVVHLREDRRHIQERDLRLFKEIIKTKLDLEISATAEMVKIALHFKPQVVTLVPEKRLELTTEGGLDVIGHREELQQAIATLRDGGIMTSLFIDPDLEQIKTAHRISADYIEIHTGRYANVQTEKERRAEADVILNAARYAAKLGLGVNAGHGLNYVNVRPLARIPEIEEFNIGHSIVARAVLVGLEKAVREMKQLLTT
jgi:pyridoxine 5-phosphate synthase